VSKFFYYSFFLTLIFFISSCCCPNLFKKPDPTPTPKTFIKLYSPIAKTYVYVATNESTLKELRKANANQMGHDENEIEQIVSRGGAFKVSSETKIQVLSKGDELSAICKVKILSAEHNGEIVYVISDWLNYRD